MLRENGGMHWSVSSLQPRHVYTWKQEPQLRQLLLSILPDSSSKCPDVRLSGSQGQVHGQRGHPTNLINDSNLCPSGHQLSVLLLTIYWHYSSL